MVNEFFGQKSISMVDRTEVERLFLQARGTFGFPDQGFGTFAEHPN